MVAFAPELVVLENIGPWAGRHEFQLFPGINILQAANGRGKTIWLSAICALARGEGKLPLNDHAKKGLVEGFKARITVGAATRHLQECELENLEGKLSLSQLVDPRHKTPAARTAARIEALVALTGKEATLATFATHVAFKDANFSTIVGAKAAACKDLCEMSDRISRDYHTAARAQEELAEKFRSEANGLDAADQDVDLSLPCDDNVLQAAYRAAIQEETGLVKQSQADNAAAERRNNAMARVEEAKRNYTGPTVAEAEEKRKAANDVLADAISHRRDLENALRLAQEREGAARAAYDETGRVLMEAALVEELIKTCQAVVSEATSPPVTDEQLTAAADKVKQAQEAVLMGQRIRQAKQNAERAKERRSDANLHDKLAAHYRETAKATDQVLSESIKNPYLFVESIRVEKANETITEARLMAKHPTRGTVPYDELSAGERWRIAIDLAADTLGEGGLIAIDQEGWEGIDAAVRPKLQEHALAKRLIVATVEATRVPPEELPEEERLNWGAPKLVQFGQAVAA